MANLLDRNTLKLLRIPFSFFLLPVFLFAVSQSNGINWFNATIIFVVLHLFIYPASNGYNSYMDEDEGSIGGLKNPPKPTKNLFYASIVFDTVGLLLALVVGIPFMLAVLLYILASRAYSYKGIRLKKYPLWGFLVVVFFQGAYTFWLTYHFVSVQPKTISEIWPVLASSSLLIAGVYPLTQVYQHEADAAAGDYTISYRLGYTGTFIFTAAMFILANVFIYLHFTQSGQTDLFIYFQLFLLPVIVYFIYWFIQVLKNTDNADFSNTMRMNALASTCMSICFVFFTLYKYL